jgi:hypothetical protein
LRPRTVPGVGCSACIRCPSAFSINKGYAFSGTAKAAFLKVSSEPKHADATPENLWKVMATKLYSDTMVSSQRGAFTSTVLDSGATVENLSERLQDLAVGLPELEGAAGDAVLLHRFIDALQEELQVHAYGISGNYDHLFASLSRIQKTLGKKEKKGVTWRYRRAEHVNEILKGACGYDDLSVEEVVQAIQDFKAGRAGGERGDGWRGGGGSGRDTAAVSSYTRSGETSAASIEAFVTGSKRADGKAVLQHHEEFRRI